MPYFDASRWSSPARRLSELTGPFSGSGCGPSAAAVTADSSVPVMHSC